LSGQDRKQRARRRAAHARPRVVHRVLPRGIRRRAEHRDRTRPRSQISAPPREARLHAHAPGRERRQPFGVDPRARRNVSLHHARQLQRLGPGPRRAALGRAAHDPHAPRGNAGIQSAQRRRVNRALGQTPDRGRGLYLLALFQIAHREHLRDPPSPAHQPRPAGRRHPLSRQDSALRADRRAALGGRIVGQPAIVQQHRTIRPDTRRRIARLPPRLDGGGARRQRRTASDTPERTA